MGKVINARHLWPSNNRIGPIGLPGESGPKQMRPGKELCIIPPWGKDAVIVDIEDLMRLVQTRAQMGDDFSWDVLKSYERFCQDETPDTFDAFLNILAVWVEKYL